MSGKYATEHRMEIVTAALYHMLSVLDNNPKLVNLNLVILFITLLMLNTNIFN